MTRAESWLFVFLACVFLALAGLYFAPGEGRFPVRPLEAVGQQTFPVPTMAPDLMTVRGSVSVIEMPPVQALQTGAWNVGVIGVPAMRLAAPTFLEPGRSYSFVWPFARDPEVHAVIEVRQDGWILTETARETRGRRWMNPAMAVAIEEMGN